MSRYRIETEAHGAWVGWDPGLGGYFAQVHRLGAEGELLAWLGAEEPLPDIADLATVLSPWMRLPDTLIDRLVRDRARSLGADPDAEAGPGGGKAAGDPGGEGGGDG